MITVALKINNFRGLVQTMKWPGYSGAAISPEMLQSHGLVVTPHRQTKVPLRFLVLILVKHDRKRP